MARAESELFPTTRSSAKVAPPEKGRLAFFGERDDDHRLFPLATFNAG
jgi:hypothetical protein